MKSIYLSPIMLSRHADAESASSSWPHLMIMCLRDRRSVPAFARQFDLAVTIFSPALFELAAA